MLLNEEVFGETRCFESKALQVPCTAVRGPSAETVWDFRRLCAPVSRAHSLQFEQKHVSHMLGNRRTRWNVINCRFPEKKRKWELYLLVRAARTL